MFYVFKQGEKTDDTLFLIIGKTILSREVHKAVGMPITSEDGDWWFIETRPSGAVWGFAILREDPDQSEIRHVYSHDEATREKLARKVLAKAKELSARRLVTHKKAEEKVWLKLGFTANPEGRRGQYERWELRV